MFTARSGPGEHVDEPDEIFVETIDGQNGREWLRIEWDGDEYEDAWILADKSDFVDLNAEE